jgi:nucleoside-diphosphate-sugar epimerase
VSASDRFLVTGALGCIGAWTVKTLVEQDVPVVAFDRATDVRRLRLIMTDEQVDRVVRVDGDITGLASIEQALDDHGISHIVHLAALQVPFCRADPPLGAAVNVVGTVNIFEAAKRHRDLVRGIAYMSSIGMFDADDADPLDGHLHVDATAHPRNLYGVYKLANEGTARVYWLDDGIASVGLRPMTVYGPGRDQGMTSGPTKAILAAVLGRPFHIGFGGRTVFQYAPDVAALVIAAARSGLPDARVLNLGGVTASIDEVIAAVETIVPEARGLISHAPDGLPFPDEIDHDGLAVLGPVRSTGLAYGIRETVEVFRERLARGTLTPEHYGLEPLIART